MHRNRFYLIYNCILLNFMNKNNGAIYPFWFLSNLWFLDSCYYLNLEEYVTNFSMLNTLFYAVISSFKTILSKSDDHTWTNTEVHVCIFITRRDVCLQTPVRVNLFLLMFYPPKVTEGGPIIFTYVLFCLRKRIFDFQNLTFQAAF